MLKLGVGGRVQENLPEQSIRTITWDRYKKTQKRVLDATETLVSR